MKWFKKAVFSLIVVFLSLGALWIREARQESPESYRLLLEEICGGKKNEISLTQTKENVQKSYAFLSKTKPFFVTMSYPSSRVFRDKNIIEEITNLQAKAHDNFTVNSFSSPKGRLNFGTNELFAEDAALTRESAEKPLFKALAKDIVLHLKGSSLTFEANGIKAEIHS